MYILHVCEQIKYLLYALSDWKSLNYECWNCLDPHVLYIYEVSILLSYYAHKLDKFPIGL